MGRNKNARPKPAAGRLREERARKAADKRADDLKARDDYVKPICEAVQNWYVGHECSHKHLPGDPKPHRCGCWGYWEVDVNAADEIWAAIALLTQRVDLVLARLETLDTLDDKANRLDTNLKGLSYQISRAGDDGRG